LRNSRHHQNSDFLAGGGGIHMLNLTPRRFAGLKIEGLVPGERDGKVKVKQLRDG
jgi:hypothetical protein